MGQAQSCGKLFLKLDTPCGSGIDTIRARTLPSILKEIKDAMKYGLYPVLLDERGGVTPVKYISQAKRLIRAASENPLPYIGTIEEYYSLKD